MIYLLITFAGIVMIFAGLYFMSLGFATPPDIFMFMLGLLLFVPGLIITLLFAGKIDLESITKASKARTSRDKKSKATVRPARRMKRLPEEVKPKQTFKTEKSFRQIKKPLPETKDESAGVSSGGVRSVSEEKIGSAGVSSGGVRSVSGVEGESADASAEKEPGRGVTSRVKVPEPATPEPSSRKMEITPSRVSPRKKEPEVPLKEAVKETAPRRPSQTRKKLFKLPKLGRKKTPESKEKPKPAKSKVAPQRTAKTLKTPPADNSYVTERLKKLKQEYIENVDDVEDLLEDRLDSFKGAINRIRAETSEPSIIWSFDASDVQDAMKETINSAEEKVMLMYPWIRNIDVSVLKKFMDTDSRLIIQEASLDDEASVELIKVLLDNNVRIRTMPHIHTVAAVSDDKNGLIISTDPIYESFEVGVIYKDKKSISEIKKLFEEAWNLSDEINLEGT
ncbi:hypothetical protein [Methanothermobacter wolfeii]|uniref:hypothetical protein n=1 Tax=Methanothermobacter wolfeii TaxID=145261 RepID=UPI0024B32C82|nr:hypothetical protein [Methanothermobacter wolfeii]MDI6702344.1 hypothetical protein [Methanothermobacter wolfeii]